MAFIEIHNVTKHYSANGAGEGAAVLRDVSLAVEEGEFVLIVGPSGSGKSTLLTVLGSMNQPSRGHVLIDGVSVYDLSPERRADFRREYVGFVFQQLQLVPYLTALENATLPLSISRLSNSAQAERAHEALRRVGLETKAHRLPGALSGGEQERVAIARAIVNHPPLILGDEPTGSLDSKTGKEIMELFRELNQSGLTICMVSHNPENARYASRIIRLIDGTVVEDSRHLLRTPPLVAVNSPEFQDLDKGERV